VKVSSEEEPIKGGLTKLELRVMQVIWKRGRCTVSAVQEELDPPLAYTTVQTMLNILERKGKLKRELEGRAYAYSATVSEAKAMKQGVRDLIDRMFGGSSEELVMTLLKNGEIDADKLAEITERYNEKAREL
jgi:predicted transcriptional regulator